MSRISVIVPMYNSEEYLRRCVDSILAQTFEDFELLLIDDGSADQTAEIAKSYCRKDERIHYYFQKNAGPDFARKSGIEKAEGNYLMFVDADDYIDCNMMQVLMQKMEEDGTDLVCTQMKRTNGNGKVWDDCKMNVPQIICTSVADSLHHFFVTRYISGSYDTKLFKKELLAGYTFLKESVIGEDVSIILYVLQHAKKVKILQDAYYYYYWNTGSISHSGYSVRHKISLLNYIKVKESLLEKRYIASEPVAGFFAEYEMAVATAMSRNWVFDKEAISILTQDLRRYWPIIRKNTSTSPVMKSCVLLFAYMPYVFMMLYRVIYLITGR